LNEFDRQRIALMNQQNVSRFEKEQDDYMQKYQVFVEDRRIKEQLIEQDFQEKLSIRELEIARLETSLKNQVAKYESNMRSKQVALEQKLADTQPMKRLIMSSILKVNIHNVEIRLQNVKSMLPDHQKNRQRSNYENAAHMRQSRSKDQARWIPLERNALLRHLQGSLRKVVSFDHQQWLRDRLLPEFIAVGEEEQIWVFEILSSITELYHTKSLGNAGHEKVGRSL